MGLIRNAIGSALAPPDMNNGINGRKMHFLGPNTSSSSSSSYNSRQPRGGVYEQDYRSDYRSSSYDSRDNRRQYQQRGRYRYEDEGYHSDRRPYSPPERRSSPKETYQQYSPKRKPKYEYREEEEVDAPPSYSLHPDPSPARSAGYYNEDGGRRDLTDNDSAYQDAYCQESPYLQSRSMDQVSSRSGPGRDMDQNFRPLALPQIDYQDGSPFLRGYSDELRYYGVTERVYFEALDAINVARIPNPENQIFQKGAGIAGFFVPGAAAIGLMAGQVGVGLASHFGHASLVNRVLSKVNLEIFVPNGLEICICKAKDVDGELGLSQYDAQRRFIPGPYPEDRVAAYGGLLAPLTKVLPPVENAGRQDPLAGIGNFLNNRATQKKVRKAQKREAKGKDKKMNRLEGSVQWIMVRQASPGAVEHWQKTLKQSDHELEQGQAQETASRRRGHSF